MEIFGETMAIDIGTDGCLLDDGVALGSCVYDCAAVRCSASYLNANDIFIRWSPHLRICRAIAASAWYAGHDILGCAVHEHWIRTFRGIRRFWGQIAVSICCCFFSFNPIIDICGLWMLYKWNGTVNKVLRSVYESWLMNTTICSAIQNNNNDMYHLWHENWNIWVNPGQKRQDKFRPIIYVFFWKQKNWRKKSYMRKIEFQSSKLLKSLQSRKENMLPRYPKVHCKAKKLKNLSLFLKKFGCF